MLEISICMKNLPCVLFKMATVDECTMMEREWVICVYHVHKEVWTAAIGEVLYNYYYKKIFQILNFLDTISEIDKIFPNENNPLYSIATSGNGMISTDKQLLQLLIFQLLAVHFELSLPLSITLHLRDSTL